jgi:uncharacterized protein YecT (DUF1311 family)
MAKIAISYRRSDSQDITGRIFDRLAQHFGKETVFRDIDSMEPGVDFRDQISKALTTSDVLLAIVGPKWLGLGEGTRHRIENEDDPVRVEVETALTRKIPIVPVLVGGMMMPEAIHLPPSLRDFAYRQAVTVDGGRDFNHHMDGLIRALDKHFAAFRDRAPAPNQIIPKKQRPYSWLARIYILVGIGFVAVAGILAALIFHNGEKSLPALEDTRASSPSVPNITGDPARADGAQAERVWAVTKDTASVGVLEDFIRQFGDTPYGSMARARLQELQATLKPDTKSDEPQGVPSPGVNCTGTGTTDEVEICGSASLMALDWQLLNIYRDLLSRLDKGQRTKLAHEESVWVKQRGECGSDENCLIAQYKKRIFQLQSMR